MHRRLGMFFWTQHFVCGLGSCHYSGQGGQKMGRQLPEIQVFLNDLPGNDFNTIFKSLPRFQKDLEKRMGAGAESCFINGVQVPQGLESNKGNIYMASSSPPCVLKVYYEQFRTDFSMFLRCRSEELLEGGSMVLTFLGRRSEDPSSKNVATFGSS
ncbi:Salicylate carboxymethyltransferase [Vitis vinifera]|uniref:Salicylate carboxymethyltransferase n=1 Tax=Vitis vinifera TaxID=29760 RepID=A0A438K6D3_VITVI|nr:Salicylate carboxymethyltransferase [Vitis vinifera]